MYFFTGTTLPVTGVAHAASAVNATARVIEVVVDFLIVHTVREFVRSRVVEW